MNEQRSTRAVNKFLDAMAFTSVSCDMNDSNGKHLVGLLTAFQLILLGQERRLSCQLPSYCLFDLLAKEIEQKFIILSLNKHIDFICTVTYSIPSKVYYRLKVCQNWVIYSFFPMNRKIPQCFHSFSDKLIFPTFEKVMVLRS